MDLKPVRTEKDYEKALERLEEIFDVQPNTPEGDELEILSLLIDKYEKENFPIDPPDPIEAVKFRMDQLGMKQKDLAKTIGFNSRVSEILHKKKKINVGYDKKITCTSQYSHKYPDKRLLKRPGRQ